MVYPVHAAVLLGSLALAIDTVLAYQPRHQCVVHNALELEHAVANETCTGIKATGFNLSDTRIDHLLADSGAEGRHLDALVLSGTKLQDGAVLSISNAIKSGQLLPETLIFWNNGLDSSSDQSSEAVYALIEIVRSASSRLKELHFTDNVLLDEGAEGLGEALQSAEMVKKLVLSGNGITPDGVASLCGHLVLSTVQSLTITGVERGANSWMTNRVEGAGGAGLAKLLSSDASQLTTLILSGTNVGDDGAEALAKGIKGSRLQTIDLHRNSISDAGAKKLAEAFAQARELKLVIFTANKIGDEGALALADAVRHNPSLLVVDIDMNMRVTSVGKTALASAFDRSVPLAPQQAVHHTEL